MQLQSYYELNGCPIWEPVKGIVNIQNKEYLYAGMCTNLHSRLQENHPLIQSVAKQMDQETKKSPMFYNAWIFYSDPNVETAYNLEEMDYFVRVNQTLDYFKEMSKDLGNGLKEPEVIEIFQYYVEELTKRLDEHKEIVAKAASRTYKGLDSVPEAQTTAFFILNLYSGFHGLLKDTMEAIGLIGAKDFARYLDMFEKLSEVVSLVEGLTYLKNLAGKLEEKKDDSVLIIMEERMISFEEAQQAQETAEMWHGILQPKEDRFISAQKSKSSTNYKFLQTDVQEKNTFQGIDISLFVEVLHNRISKQMPSLL